MEGEEKGRNRMGWDGLELQEKAYKVILDNKETGKEKGKDRNGMGWKGKRRKGRRME